MIRFALIALGVLASCLVHAQPRSPYEAQFDPNLPETERIRNHLTAVVEELRAKPTVGLSEDQATRRATILEVLAKYAERGSFPVNDTADPWTPVFIDRAGTACAVGHLMIESGAEALARDIATCENLAYLPEIATPGVKEWAESFGLTLEECALIQPTYLAEMLDEVTVQSQTDGVQIDWTVEGSYEVLYTSVSRNGLLIMELWGPGLVEADFTHLDTEAADDVHEYRVFVSDSWNFDVHFSTVIHPEKWFVRGDANGNGVLEGIADPIFLLSYAFVGGPPPPCLDAADSNGNGVFEGISDALYVLSFSHAAGPPPPLPFPNCDLAEATGPGCAVLTCP
ncbi:MAG: hypothetical protein AAF488_03295 [Planctomycetota bacterium]